MAKGYKKNVVAQGPPPTPPGGIELIVKIESVAATLRNILVSMDDFNLDYESAKLDEAVENCEDVAYTLNELRKAL